MKIIESELNAAFDIDGTLAHVNTVNPIEENVQFLKDLKSRGYHITVWSAAGFRRAEEVVKALQLEPYVDVIMTKMLKHCDDLTDIEDIVGRRVFLAKELPPIEANNSVSWPAVFATLFIHIGLFWVIVTFLNIVVCK